MHSSKDRRIEPLMNTWMEGQEYKWMVHWIVEWTAHWIVEWTDGWYSMNR